MNEIKVKSYGLINFTKRQYVILQVVVFTLLVLIFLGSYLYDYAASGHFMIKHARVGSIIVIVLEIFEIFFMLRKFNKKSEG
jgi:hypothetical protein